MTNKRSVFVNTPECFLLPFPSKMPTESEHSPAPPRNLQCRSSKIVLERGSQRRGNESLWTVICCRAERHDGRGRWLRPGPSSGRVSPTDAVHARRSRSCWRTARFPAGTFSNARNVSCPPTRHGSLSSLKRLPPQIQQEIAREQDPQRKNQMLRAAIARIEQGFSMAPLLIPLQYAWAEPRRKAECPRTSSR